jgi:hypothetical protein
MSKHVTPTTPGSIGVKRKRPLVFMPIIEAYDKKVIVENMD